MATWPVCLTFLHTPWSFYLEIPGTEPGTVCKASRASPTELQPLPVPLLATQPLPSSPDRAEVTFAVCEHLHPAAEHGLQHRVLLGQRLHGGVVKGPANVQLHILGARTGTFEGGGPSGSCRHCCAHHRFSGHLFLKRTGSFGQGLRAFWLWGGGKVQPTDQPSPFPFGIWRECVGKAMEASVPRAGALSEQPAAKCSLCLLWFQSPDTWPCHRIPWELLFQLPLFPEKQRPLFALPVKKTRASIRFLATY